LRIFRFMVRLIKAFPVKMELHIVYRYKKRRRRCSIFQFFSQTISS
jgi:hypothetical protein